MHIEPVAALRCWAVDVDVAGRTYTIPALPAADWLLAIEEGAASHIVPGLLDDPTVLDDDILDGLVDGDECLTAARAAIAAAAGTPWWTAVRLARAAVDTHLGGELLLRGVDPARLSLAAYLAAAYRALTAHMSTSSRARLDFELDIPPASVPPQEWWDEDAAAAGFMAALGASR